MREGHNYRHHLTGELLTVRARIHMLERQAARQEVRWRRSLPHALDADEYADAPRPTPGSDGHQAREKFREAHRHLCAEKTWLGEIEDELEAAL